MGVVQPQACSPILIVSCCTTNVPTTIYSYVNNTINGISRIICAQIFRAINFHVE